MNTRCRKWVCISLKCTCYNGRDMDFHIISVRNYKHWQIVSCITLLFVIGVFLDMKLNLINLVYVIIERHLFSQITTKMRFYYQIWTCDPLSKMQVSNKGRWCGVKCEVSCEYAGLPLHSMGSENWIWIEFCGKIARNMEQRIEKWMLLGVNCLGYISTNKVK